MSISGNTDGLTEQSKVASSVKNGILQYPFWLGGSASCLAAGVTHPLDLGEIYPLLLRLGRPQRALFNLRTLVKVRLQTRSADGPRTMMSTFVHIVRNNGLQGLYNGVCICDSPIRHGKLDRGKKIWAF